MEEFERKELTDLLKDVDGSRVLVIDAVDSTNVKAKHYKPKMEEHRETMESQGYDVQVFKQSAMYDILKGHMRDPTFHEKDEVAFKTKAMDDALKSTFDAVVIYGGCGCCFHGHKTYDVMADLIGKEKVFLALTGYDKLYTSTRIKEEHLPKFMVDMEDS
ncbi:hypothetical protein HOC80_02425 [archaeon]|jgi:hypothetical protein|nr:hypothetical protein [archaeon]MBT4416935.1 hypothetical protein [archaeon]